MVRRDILLLVLKNVKYTQVIAISPSFNYTDVFLLYAVVFAPPATAIATLLTGFFTVIRSLQPRRR